MKEGALKLFEYMWMLPFIFFSLGYLVCGKLLKNTDTIVPKVIGESLQESTKQISASGLNVRIISEKENSNISEGMTLNQYPEAGQKIKINQYVFLTISKHPDPIKTPSFYGLGKEEISKKSKGLGVEVKRIPVRSFFPQGTCFAQSPAPENDLTSKVLLVYISTGQDKKCVFPNLIGERLQDVQDLISQKNVSLQVCHEAKYKKDHVCQECFIKDQNPKSGAIIDLNKNLYVQLLLGEKKDF
jgi:eukaryotic-like serine/threonine-protein kinase